MPLPWGGHELLKKVDVILKSEFIGQREEEEEEEEYFFVHEQEVSFYDIPYILNSILSHLEEYTTNTTQKKVTI